MALKWQPKLVSISSLGYQATSYPGKEGSLGEKNSKWADQVAISQYYSSFSGADIIATAIIPGETAPVTFATLRTLSYNIVRDKRAVRILGCINPIGWSLSNRLVAGTLVFTSFDRYVWAPMYGAMDETESGRMILADTLPPFDIVVSALNEYGQMSRLLIRGVRIVDEGAVLGVDDMFIEESHTFVAIDVVPWIPTDRTTEEQN